MRRKASAAAVPRELLPWLAPARRRARVRRLLAAAFWALGANLLLLALLEAAARVFKVGLVTPDIGLLVFAVLAARVFASEDLPRAALLLDRRLDLKNRLASALDFHGRAGVDASYKAAQLAETLETLAGRRVSPEPRIPPLFWTAPVLLLLYVAFTSTYPFGSLPSGWEGRRTMVTLRRPDSSRTAGDAGRTLSRGGEPGRGETREPPPDEPASEPEEAPAAPRAQAPEERPLTPEQETQPPGAASRADGQPEVGTGVIPEPAQLFSETVTKELTPLGVDRGSRGADTEGMAEIRPPRGGVSFNLLAAPGRLAKGADGPGGGGEGGSSEPLEVVVDFESVPAELRECVRRYFESLQRAGKGESRGTEG